MKIEDVIKRNELIYWIDKAFVQWRVKELYNEEFDDEAIQTVRKYIEYGLECSVFDIIDIAIHETKYTLTQTNG